MTKGGQVVNKKQPDEFSAEWRSVKLACKDPVLGETMQECFHLIGNQYLSKRNGFKHKNVIYQGFFPKDLDLKSIVRGEHNCFKLF